jgi:hypothetical protein
MVNTMLLAFELLFGCWHRDLSRPFTLSGWTYEVCLNCGKKLAYDRADIGCVVVARRTTPGRSEVDFADKLLSAMRYQFGATRRNPDDNSEAA